MSCCLEKLSSFVAFLIVIILVTTTEMVFSQCDFSWKSGQELPGLNGSVNSLTTWDPDGAGPQQELLIAGGSFTIAGKSLVSNIAAWDGNSWQSLGTGTGGEVHSMAVYNGKLIAGGVFSTAGSITLQVGMEVHGKHCVAVYKAVGYFQVLVH